MNIVITAGGTSEYIDKVRKITNSGSGRLGALIGERLLKREDVDKIFYICSEKAAVPENKWNRLEIIRVRGTTDLKQIVENVLSCHEIHWFIHSMAVSDYYVDAVTTAEKLAGEIASGTELIKALKNPKDRIDSSDKISSYEDDLVLVLKQTPKIIRMVKELSPDTRLIGFKLLENATTEGLIQAAGKLRDKNHCDYVLANDLKDIGQNRHKAYLLDRNNDYGIFFTKDEIATAISNIIPTSSAIQA